MNEEQQISEAWETYSVIRDTRETPEETFENGVRSGIEIGRLAALRDLMEVSDVNSLRHGESIELFNVEWHTGTVNRPLPSSAPFYEWRDCGIVHRSPIVCGDRVFRVIPGLPSPSDLFTEGRV